MKTLFKLLFLSLLLLSRPQLFAQSNWQGLISGWNTRHPSCKPGDDGYVSVVYPTDAKSGAYDSVRFIYINDLSNTYTDARHNALQAANAMGQPVIMVYSGIQPQDHAPSGLNMEGIEQPSALTNAPLTNAGQVLNALLPELLVEGQRVRVFAHSRGAAVVHSAAGLIKALLERQGGAALLSMLEIISLAGSAAPAAKWPAGLKVLDILNQHGAWAAGGGPQGAAGAEMLTLKYLFEAFMPWLIRLGAEVLAPGIFEARSFDSLTPPDDFPGPPDRVQENPDAGRAAFAGKYGCTGTSGTSQCFSPGTHTAGMAESGIFTYIVTPLVVTVRGDSLFIEFTFSTQHSGYKTSYATFTGSENIIYCSGAGLISGNEAIVHMSSEFSTTKASEAIVHRPPPRGSVEEMMLQLHTNSIHQAAKTGSKEITHSRANIKFLPEGRLNLTNLDGSSSGTVFYYKRVP